MKQKDQHSSHDLFQREKTYVKLEWRYLNEVE